MQRITKALSRVVPSSVVRRSSSPSSSLASPKNGRVTAGTRHLNTTTSPSAPASAGNMSSDTAAASAAAVQAGKTETNISANSVLDLIKNRRTYYPLSKDLAISKERIQEIVREAVLHVPSSFNSQSNRVVVLFGAEHDKFWDITTEVLRAIVPADKFEPTAQKLAMFKGAAGSVLFFEDKEVVDGMAAKFPLYADKFPVWATQSDAMLQFTIWTALEAEGLGANLQHYNPLVDEKVAETWKIPANWKLNAQLVFGGRTGEAGEKTFQPLEQRFRVYGA